MGGWIFLRAKNQIQIRSTHQNYKKDSIEAETKAVATLKELLGTIMYDYYKQNKDKYRHIKA
ncbi:hypothetical protein [Psychrobacillus sp. L3]|uniref:hypothetical protein n=1 Tax=Psychrobacillus sp. L3 TaxID=3236891 RepID=UPI0036F1C5A1